MTALDARMSSVPPNNVDYKETFFVTPSDLGLNGGAANTAVVAQRLYLCRFIAPRAFSGINLGFAVGTADTADNPVYAGLYDSTLTNKLADSGAVSGKLNATGSMSVPIATSGAKGQIYYTFLLIPTITTSLSLYSFTTNGPITGLLPQGPPNGMGLTLNGQATPPANASAAAAGNTVPLILIREV